METTTTTIIKVCKCGCTEAEHLWTFPSYPGSSEVESEYFSCRECGEAANSKTFDPKFVCEEFVLDHIEGAKPNEKLALSIINNDYEWVSVIEFMNEHPDYGAEYEATGYHVYNFGYTNYSDWQIEDDGAWDAELKVLAVDENGVATRYSLYGCERVN